MTRLTRILFLSVFLLSLFLNSASGVAAAGSLDFFLNNTSVDNNVSKTIDAVVKSSEQGIPSQESNVDNTLKALQTSAFIFIAGPNEDLVISMSEEQKRLVEERYGGGAISGVTKAMAALYSPPASGRTYVADVLESAHIVPQAQAQGLGFSALDPILDTWKVFRNIAYLFFVVIFLVIGFMIMFRQKIGGQTVVTAQQAIPGVIVSLLFVTFSYAIAGFLIDIMYLLMYLMVGIFPEVGGSEILNQSIFGFSIDLLAGAEGAFSTVSGAVQGFVESIAGNVNTVEQILSVVAGITLALIVSIAVLIGIFKLFFELLKTYVTLIIAIATAPITLMFGAIPGRNTFTKWLQTIAGNLIAFPVVLLALILFKMFTAEGNSLESGGFSPPFLLGTGQGQAVLVLVGIGVILIMPELVKEAKKAMGADGGIWEQLSGAAISQFQEGLPVGAKIGGLGLGAAGGSLVGLGRALEETQGRSWNAARFLDIGKGIVRGAGDGASRGTKAAGSIAQAAGGKTPAGLQLVEQGVDYAGNYLSSEEQLRRAEEYDPSKKLPFQQQLKQAQERGKVKRHQAQHGHAVPMDKSGGNPEADREPDKH